MNYRTPIIGIASALGVLVVMVAARLLVSKVEAPELLELREVEIATLQDPPPPPPPPPPEKPLPTPPPPALTSLSEVPDPTRIPLPEVDVPQPLDIPVDPFHLDHAPAPLPAPPAPRVAATPAPRTSAPRPSPSKPSRRPPPAPVAKSHYAMSELDGRPRLIRHPSVAFPASLASRGVRAGTVTLEVELSTEGRVSVRRVISASHQDLVSKARYVANGARFTPPKRGGRPVKAIMRWPITIKEE